MDLCVPYEEALTNQQYYKIVNEPFYMDQIASILVRYNNWDNNL